MTIRFTHPWLKFRAIARRLGTQCSKPVTQQAHLFSPSLWPHCRALQKKAAPELLPANSVLPNSTEEGTRIKASNGTLYSSAQIGRERKLPVSWRPGDAVRVCLPIGLSPVRLLLVHLTKASNWHSVSRMKPLPLSSLTLSCRHVPIFLRTV